MAVRGEAKSRFVVANERAASTMAHGMASKPRLAGADEIEAPLWPMIGNQMLQSVIPNYLRTHYITRGYFCPGLISLKGAVASGVKKISQSSGQHRVDLRWNSTRFEMTMNTKVLMGGLGLLAAVTAPTVAIAQPRHVQVHHDRVERAVPPPAPLSWGRQAAPPDWGYGGALPPLYTPCGNIRDRQTYGVNGC